MSIRLLPVLLLLGSFSFSQTTPPDEPATFSAHGQVVEDPSGKPLRKVDVHFMQYGAMSPKDYATSTDAEGKFQVDDLKPGRYHLSLGRPGFVESRTSNRSGSLTLNTADDAKDLVLHMQAAGIISGKIVDKDGDPIANASVQATASKSGHIRHSGLLGFASTNDLGEFRISNLRPAKYVLIVNAPSRAPSTAPTDAEHGYPKIVLNYAPTYYPGTLDKSQAVALDVRSGDEVSVTISPMETQTFSIRGTVINPGGTGLMQIMLRAPDSRSMDHHASVAPDGSFEFTELLPGLYTPYAIVMNTPMEELQRGGTPQLDFMRMGRPLEVSNANLEGIHLTPEVPGHVRGRFRMDKGQKIDWTQLNVLLRPLDQQAAQMLNQARSGFSIARLKADGSFDFPKVPAGEYCLAVTSSSSALQDYFTKSIELGGKDVADTGFTVSGGSYALDVVVASDGGTIEGIVVDSKGKPKSEAIVLAAPSGERRKRFDVFGHTTSDSQGHFKMRGLIPGEYTVLAWEESDEDLTDPEVLDAYQEHGEKVQIEAGSAKNVSVKLIENDDSEPASVANH